MVMVYLPEPKPGDNIVKSTILKRIASLALCWSVIIIAAIISTALLRSIVNPVAAQAPTPRMVPVFPEEWHWETGSEATFAAEAMITADSRRAAEAGLEILRQGGNAIDAAVATGFALAVTHPMAGNLGGGGFMVIRLADGTSTAIDYRETAPLAATPNMYLDESGEKIHSSKVGHLAVAVPGSVAGLAAAQGRFGHLKLGDVIKPAIRLAEEGFEVDSMLSMVLRRFSPVLTRFGGKEIFYEDNHPLEPGTRLIQPELAWTLRTIADQGPNAFYRGEISDLIVKEMERGKGLISYEDLATYRPVWRKPIEAEYRGFPVISMPPASSGGVAIVEALNVLETYDSLPAFHSATYKHLLTEVLRRVFVDRNTELCDLDFCDPPIERLTSGAYARELRETIDPNRATPSPPPPELPEGMHTTHYSVVDGEGNAVATTTTLNGPGGSGVFVESAGFFLNNEMDDFSTSADPNMFGLAEGAQNRVEPGKRPLSSMSPTIILDQEDEVLLVMGGAGGPMIPTGTLQMILNVVDHRMSWGDAMHAPRLHHQAWPDTLMYETGGLHTSARDSLAAMGHALLERPGLMSLNGIMRSKEGWHGLTQPIPPGFPEPAAAVVGY